MEDSILIVGTSARAATFSALRAGLRPMAIDLFADRDLSIVCPVHRVQVGNYPEALPALARDAPPGPWMYTGGLEIRPEIVERIARERWLWGNNAECLRRARDPFAMFAALRAANLPCPTICRSDERQTGQWLLKPIAGSGGAAIRLASGDTGHSRDRARRDYLQEFVEGESRSGVFVADDSRCRLLGVTRQLVGIDWLHASAFRYAGSIGPLAVSEMEKQGWERLGTAVTAFAGLRGLFGLDAIVRDGVPWPVEINPRYTASVEVIENATGVIAMALHRHAFAKINRAGRESDGFSPNPLLSRPARTGVVGKAIWYAPRSITIPPDGPWEPVLRRPPALDEPPAFADIPAARERIAKGRPVLTFFAVAASVEKCELELRRTAAEFDRLLR
jgi:predicted ATP-grasp superfamily ATP-dependent carboligase